ncbi:GTP cyclohydrolase I FolE [Kitasatospora sp. NPDC093558]|uniref:GTP cyclohydrolase I n=1 Tax=Kitasatospora sp. NPDC093558 TaxID=3155201 RepID=UPI0034215797
MSIPVQAQRRPVDRPRVAQLTRELLLALGEDPERDGLKNTPRRVADWWGEFLNHAPGRLDTAFAQEGQYGDFVLLTGIEAWSVCEHHLLPFRLDVSIAYVPDTAVLGLSKLVRHLQAHTHALQLQERITHDVAHDLAKAAGTDDVAVFTVGEHLCMSMRGVKATAVRTSTMCRLGRTESDPALATRIERLALPVRR